MAIIAIRPITVKIYIYLLLQLRFNRYRSWNLVLSINSHISRFDIYCICMINYTGVATFGTTLVWLVLIWEWLLYYRYCGLWGKDCCFIFLHFMIHGDLIVNGIGVMRLVLLLSVCCYRRRRCCCCCCCCSCTGSSLSWLILLKK